jgi:hypothetical protein
LNKFVSPPAFSFSTMQWSVRHRQNLEIHQYDPQALQHVTLHFIAYGITKAQAKPEGSQLIQNHTAIFSSSSSSF